MILNNIIAVTGLMKQIEELVLFVVDVSMILIFDCGLCIYLCEV